MKKLVSIIVLIGMVFMLEFNLLEPLLGKASNWIEPLLAFAVLIALGVWNDIHLKSR